MLNSFSGPINVCIFGASGGIGHALAQHLANDPAVAIVHAGTRSAIRACSKLRPFPFDLTDEAMIAASAQIIGASGPVHLIIIATGLLHDGDSMKPEKSYSGQSADGYARAFAINATGPALIGKHFLPLLPREGRSVFAALSARVSSVSDNRLGGWHAYRASKAALNMIVRNFAVELGRTHKDAVAVTLHPGTVNTALSKPFQRNVLPEKLFTADFAAERLLSVIDGLEPKDSGNLIAWDAQRIDF
jgi:NAD(P)-dependent dehydrogenase (short-subunit alcohol dehydrogenase family)